MPYGDNEYVLLRIFVRESQVYESVELLKDMGFEGCTVLRGIMGYGKTGPTSADIVIESLDLPAVIEIFTTYKRFKEKSAQLKKLFNGLITIERAKPVF
jgi:PII-like signaling protein